MILVIVHFRIVDGYPADAVALASSSALTLSASKRTVAVLLAKSTETLLTPSTFSSDFRTVIWQRLQVMFCTTNTTVCKVADSAVEESAAAMNTASMRRTLGSPDKNGCQQRHRKQTDGTDEDDPEDQAQTPQDEWIAAQHVWSAGILPKI